MMLEGATGRERVEEAAASELAARLSDTANSFWFIPIEAPTIASAMMPVHRRGPRVKMRTSIRGRAAASSDKRPLLVAGCCFWVVLATTVACLLVSPTIFAANQAAAKNAPSSQHLEQRHEALRIATATSTKQPAAMQENKGSLLQVKEAEEEEEEEGAVYRQQRTSSSLFEERPRIGPPARPSVSNSNDNNKRRPAKSLLAAASAAAIQDRQRQLANEQGEEEKEKTKEMRQTRRVRSSSSAESTTDLGHSTGERFNRRQWRGGGSRVWTGRPPSTSFWSRAQLANEFDESEANTDVDDDNNNNDVGVSINQVADKQQQQRRRLQTPGEHQVRRRPRGALQATPEALAHMPAASSANKTDSFGSGNGGAGAQAREDDDGGEPVTVINGMLRGQVILKCNLKPRERDSDEVSLILWYKDNSMVPIFSVDARASPVLEARHKPGAWLEGRSSLRIVEEEDGNDENEANGENQQQHRGHEAGLGWGATSIPAASSKRARPRFRRRPSDNDDLEEKVYHKAETPSSSSSSPSASPPSSFFSPEQWPRLSENLARLESAWSPFGSNRRQARRSVAVSADQDDENEDEARQTVVIHEQLPEAAARLSEPTKMGAANGTPNRSPSSASRDKHLVAHLLVDSLSSEDNGFYKCRVDFRRSRSRVEQLELKIIVPAEKPLIRDLTSGTPGGRLVKNNLAGPHDESSRVLLECETSGGYPEPSVTWWRNGRLVDDSYEIVSATDGSVLERRAGSGSSTGAPLDAYDELADGTRPIPQAPPQPVDAEPYQLGGGGGGPRSHEPTMADARQQSAHSTGQREQQQQQQGSQTGAASAQANRLIRNRLELVGLTRDDLLANYSCQASNSKLGDPPTSYVMIDMNLRPIRVQIENERQPVLAGKPIEIVCRAYGSRPAALISWHLNKSRLVGGGASDGGPAGSGTNSGGGSSSIVMDSSSGATDTSVGSGSSSVQQITESISSDSNITTSVLSFTPQIEHTGKLLACRATNELIANRANQQQLQQQQHTLPVTASPSLAQLEDTWKLEVHYLPRVRLALGEKLANRQAVQVGHDVYFECATQAEPPVHELRWWFNGKELETNVSQGVIISNQSLVLQRVGRHQRGKYTCSAMNSVGESRSNSVQLRIQHEPYCQDTSPLTHKGTQFGGGGHGTSTNLIDDDDNNSNYDDHLMFGADEGARLRNTNNHPMMTSGGRRAQIHHKSHYGAARSESVRVYCHVDADPSEPISYKWAFVAKGQQQQQQSSSASATRPPGVPTTSSPNGSAGRPEWSGQQVVYLNSSLYSSAPDNNPLVSVLVYTPKSELDYGTLLCWAQNSLGQQQEPCVYRVVPAERPEPLRNCRLLNATDSQLAIGCEPGYDGGIDQSFHMEVYEANRPDQLVANLTNIAGLTDTGILPFGWQRHPSNGSSSGEFQDDSADDSLLTSISSNSDLDLYDAEAAQQQQQTTTISSQRGQQQQQLAAASLISSETALASNNSSRQQKQRHSNHQPAHQRPPKSHSLANNGQLPNTEAIFLTEPQLAPATNYLITVYSANSKGASKPIAFTASTSNQSVAGGDLRLSNGMGPGSSLLAGREGRRSPIMNVDQTSALINEVLSLTWSPFLLVCAVTVLIFVLFASITFALIKYVDLTALVGSPTNGPTGSGGGGSSGQLRDGHTAATRHNQSPGKASALSSTPSGSTSGSGSGGGASNAGSHYGTTGGNHNQQPSLCLANEFVGDDDGQLTAVTTSQRDEDFGDAGDGRHSIELPALKPRQPTGQQDQHFMSATLGRPPVALAGNPGQAGLARVIAMGGLGGASSNWPTTINSSTASRAELEIPLNGMPLNTKRASLLDGSYLRAKIQQLTTANSNAGQQQQQQQQLSIGYASGGGQPISKMKQSNSDNFLNQTELGVTGGQPDFTSTTGGANNWFQCRTPHYQAAYWASCGGTLPRPLPFGYQNNSNNNHVGQQQQQGQANHYLDMEAPAYGYLKLVSNSGQQQQQLLSSAIHNNHHHHHHAAEHSPGGQHFELPAAQAIQSNGGVGADLASMAAFTFNNNNQVSASPSVNLAPAQTTLNCSTMANNTASNSGGSPMEHLLISGKQYIHQTRPIPFNEQHQQQQLQLTSQQQQRPGAVSSSSGTSMASRPSGGHHHQQQIGPCCQVAANGHNDDGPPVSCQTPQAVLFHTNAQTTNCCLVANGDHQQQQQNLTPKTSDLGDDVNDDDYDDEQDVLHGGLEMGDTTIIRGGGQFGACSASSECGQYQTIGANGPNNTFGATDSDGISSQGTQKSSSNLTNNTNNPPTSTTLGSPSSGFATEPCCNEQSTMAATWRQPDQQQQQHRTSQLKGSHHQQDQQIVTTCDASSKSATKLAGARNTRKSLVLDSYDDHYNHAPINYDTNNNNTDINNNNNNLAQFYLLSDDHPETTTIQHSSNSNHASSTTLIRLANKSRVRLVTPTSQQQANHVDDDDDGDDEPPPIALVACNQTTNNYNHQPSRLVSHHARQSLPKSGTLSLLAPNGTTATIDDLATPPCDLQTDV